MSCFKICDGEDCNNTENDGDGVYHIDYETTEYLKEHHKNSFNYSVDDICDSCIEIINEDYEEDFPLLIIDEHQNLSINKNYKRI